jgi:dTDP-glucose 4,6-dehydratase
MTILVTGGAGFIGSNFILQWIKEYAEPVVNLDKLTYAGNIENLASVSTNKKYNFIKGDINDYDLVLMLLSRFQVRAIINLAAESHVDRSISSPEDFIQTNVVGTFRLLEAARKYFAGLSHEDQSRFRFIHISTDEVYGSLSEKEPPFRETTAYRPNSPYSASKAASDHLVRAYHHTYNFPVLTTNCSNNYGPFQFPEKLIPLIIHNALTGRSLPIYGDGANIRDWLFVDDHCAAICCVLENGALGKTYNIGGSNEKTNLDVVSSICEILDELRPKPNGSSYRSQITFVNDRPGHDKRYAIDASKITQQLNWRPTETFETGMHKTIQWYLNNKLWMDNVTSITYNAWTSHMEAQYE